jgi:hypothetical protein
MPERQAMRAVWSFWMKPYQAHRRAIWMSEKHHLLAWALSLACAREHYAETWLYTEDDGARLLIDRLGLEFTHVSTALDALAGADPNWWALGKLYAYRLQETPFVHLDNDVFLWKRLPAWLEEAPIFTQNPEPFRPGASYYQPERMTAAVSRAGGWLPTEWYWYRSASSQRGDCCGILGANRTDFVRYFSELAIALIEHPRNQAAWGALDSKIAHMVSPEQYLLTACLEYHRHQSSSPYRDVQMQYLFSSAGEAFDRARATELGFTHLIAGAKRSSVYVERLERRVQRDLPLMYERCERVAAQSPDGL